MNIPAQITARPVTRPQYKQAESFDAWITINADLVMTYWRDLRIAAGQDPDRFAYAKLFDFAVTQYQVSNSPEPQQPMPGSPALVEGSSPTAGIGTADAGTPRQQVTCRARYYDAASTILEEEGELFSHDNVDELGHVIQKWIEETRNNWAPR